jgi:hypothetical protein
VEIRRMARRTGTRSIGFVPLNRVPDIAITIPTLYSYFFFLYCYGDGITSMRVS